MLGAQEISEVVDIGLLISWAELWLNLRFNAQQLRQWRRGLDRALHARRIDRVDTAILEQCRKRGSATLSSIRQRDIRDTFLPHGIGVAHEENRLLRVHLGLDLLAHRTPEQIGPPPASIPPAPERPA